MANKVFNMLLLCAGNTTHRVSAECLTNCPGLSRSGFQNIGLNELDSSYTPTLSSPLDTVQMETQAWVAIQNNQEDAA